MSSQSAHQYEAKEQQEPALPRMAELEESEGHTSNEAAIHTAVKHPPRAVAREVLYTRPGRKAILTKSVRADSAASGRAVPLADAVAGGNPAVRAIDELPPRAVLITCGGAGGGPGHLGCAGPSSVYESLALQLPHEHDIAVLQVVYSKVSNVPDGMADVRAAIDYCLERRWGPLILMGWSMGSAVIAQAGAPYAKQSLEALLPTGGSVTVPVIRALITLAGQSAGVEALANYDPRSTAFLMLHGDADDCLPARCADALHARAPRGATKQILILPNNHHGVQDAEPVLLRYIPKLVA